MQIQYIKNLHSKKSVETTFGSRALLNAVSNEIPNFINSVVIVPISSDGSRLDASVLIFDTQQKLPFDACLSFVLMEVSGIIAESFAHDERELKNIGDMFRPGMAETSPSPGLNPHRQVEPTSQFLIDTLVKRRSLKSRNGVSFITARTWRAALKPYQIKALCALKRDPPASLIDVAAAELAEIVTNVGGGASYAHVVPVPCGHTKNELCFSVLLAGATARMLRLEPLLAFEDQPRPGSSHPRKNPGLKPYTWRTLPTGPVLLIDDVVSSGAHIEHAVKQLREKVALVSAVAWIGP